MQENLSESPRQSAAATMKQSVDRSPPAKFIGKLVILLTVISFLFVGIFVNIFQVLLAISVRVAPHNRQWRRWHKKLNSYLVYVLFSPPICLLYYWSNMSLRIQLDDLQLIEMAQKSLLAIIIPNHTYELDYMVSFVLADQLGGVGSYKSMSKEELRYLPVIGWAMWMSDIIFVKRDWKRDRKTIGKKLDALFDYDQTILGIFAEGTRFSEEKHRLSVEFAKSRQMEPYKYHLVPRARGFNYTVRHYLHELKQQQQIRLSEEEFKILNLQIVMPDRPKFRDFINGRQLVADVYCEEVRLSQEIKEEVHKSSDEDDCPKLTQLLMDIYRRKDQLVEEYNKSGGKFPENPKTGGLFPYRRSNLVLFVWAAGFVLTYGSLGYLAWNYLARSVLFWTLLTSFIVACVQMLKRIARESKIPRNSTPAAAAVASEPTPRSKSNGIPVKQKLV